MALFLFPEVARMSDQTIERRSILLSLMTSHRQTGKGMSDTLTIGACVERNTEFAAFGQHILS